MSYYLIEGGNRLEGATAISGAKNSVLKLMAASLLARGTTVLTGVPRIIDVFTMAEMLGRLGAEVTFDEDRVTIDASGGISTEAPYELVRKMRASFNVLGPLLARQGHARVAMPGGCNIGSRPVDLHQQALSKLGVKFRSDHGYLEGNAPDLAGDRVILEYPSRGATENLLYAATLARGTTVIENAAREPDIIDLAEFLNRMGARVEGAGTSTIEVAGVSDLEATSYRVPSDPIEAGTLALAVLATRGDAELVGARVRDLEIVLEKLGDSGAGWEATDRGIRVWITDRPKAVDFVTLPFPGFPTDLQAPMVAYLATADGTSIATENIFESRFLYVDELIRMGADIRVEGHHAVIRGVSHLEGAPVRCFDIRAGASMIVAGLGAQGSSEVHDVHHIERGYERLDEKLASLGASIDRREAAPVSDA